MYCPKCGNDNPNGSTFCQSCGAPMGNQAPAPAGNGKGMAAAALVLGILSCILWWIPYVSIFALIMSIAGLVLGVKARKEMDPQNRGLATAGMVLCIIGVVLSGLGFITCTLPVMTVGCAACAAANTLGSLSGF